VVDAVSGFGVEHLDMPLLPEKVWQAMQGQAVPMTGGGTR
jgi:hypothetical protein